MKMPSWIPAFGRTKRQRLVGRRRERVMRSLALIEYAIIRLGYDGRAQQWVGRQIDDRLVQTGIRQDFALATFAETLRTELEKRVRLEKLTKGCAAPIRPPASPRTKDFKALAEVWWLPEDGRP